MSHHSVPAIMALLLTLGGAIGPIPPAACITLAQAGLQPPRQFSQRSSPESPRSARKENWLQELNLNKEQLQKIQEIRRRYQDRLAQQRQSVKQAQQDLKALMASGDASSEQIRQRFNQVQTLQQALADTRMESMLAIRSVLTTDQRQKLNEFMRQRGKTRRGMGADL